ncbi:MAG TPA: multidrug efflux RND transporter permease subunit [Ferrovibrio sp.]|uniref:efflux RND transporter permease subunit n=1 Tax=Ferrovibrio sp. TaxID=1917215 RepID=UPI002ED3B14A
MTLPELCIRRPVMTALLMITFVVVGIFGYRLLPVAALPRVDFPTINVSASLPGASPETMASAVATPLEKQFSTIAGITSMTSVNGLGTTQITLQFDLGRNIDGAALDVQSAITAAMRLLPDEMTTPPSFRKVNPADQPILFLALNSDTLPLSTVDEYAETVIAQRLSTLTGVAQVSVYGAQKYAVRVQVDPKTLAAAGISFDDIANALAAANSNKPVGQIDGPRQAVTLQASGQLATAASYRPLIIAYRNGNPVRLGDVAQIIDGVENNRVASWYNGKRSITLAIQRQPDANTVEVVDRVKALLPEFRAALPAQVNLDVLLDRSQSIRDSVDDVQFTLALTVALVVMVIFLFLRSLSATVIPMLALPVSIIGAFAGMYLLGFTIDNLSLLALTLSVGFVVDDAIVMLENIVRHVESGLSPFQAALKGSKEIAFTIMSITLSLVAVFIPVLFMGGVVGRLFNEFAVTISLAILISGFVSLTLTPMLCSRFLRHDQTHAGKTNGKKRELFILTWFEAIFTASFKGYERSLRFVLDHRFAVLLATIGTILLTGYLYVVVPKGFFPNEDTGQILVVTEAPQDISFEGMAQLQQEAAAIALADPAVDAVNSSIGTSGLSSSMNQGRMFIGLKPLDERHGEKSDAIIQRLRRKMAGLPDMKVYLQSIQNIRVGGRLSKSQYQYTVQGDDFHQLQEIVPKLEARLRNLPQMQDVSSDLQVRSPQALVDIDREKAAALGVTADTIRQTLYSAFGDRQVSTIYTPSNEYAVILQVSPRYQENPSSLKDIYVRAADGHLVPLDSVAQVKFNVGPSTVNHQGQLPAVTISFNLAPGYSLGQAVDAIRQVEQEMNLPATIITSFQGTAQVFQDSLKGQGLLLAAAVFVIYVMLGILYESFIHPITILSGLPAASVGALLTLILFKTDLSVIAMIGIVMLIGIVKKNAIMMIDVALEKRRKEKLAPPDAILQAALLRYRPIMMTTVAAIMGALPIAIGTGAGAELRQPLGLVVVGGLLVSQVLTLYITPVIYLYLDKVQTRLSRGHHRPIELVDESTDYPKAAAE